MTYSCTLIDAVKKAENLPSDNKAAERLGLSRQFISNIRNERKNLSPEQALIAAEIAGINPKIALLRLLRETIKNLEVRHCLEELEEEYQRLKDAS
jgi:plasmid maintenance system antidote protein VapI